MARAMGFPRAGKKLLLYFFSFSFFLVVFFLCRMYE